MEESTVDKVNVHGWIIHPIINFFVLPKHVNGHLGFISRYPGKDNIFCEYNDCNPYGQRTFVTDFLQKEILDGFIPTYHTNIRIKNFVCENRLTFEGHLINYKMGSALYTWYGAVFVEPICHHKQPLNHKWTNPNNCYEITK